MNYPGFQIGIAVQFGVMSDKFFVDIGVGDVVDPVLLEWPSFNYKEKPLFEDLISLEVYPVETIFSEKLETLISRGAANSRMKDYHDLLLLCRESKLIDKIRLKDNIIQTFQNRGTVFSLPVQFQPDELERMQLLWSGHLRVLGAHRVQVLGLPEKIDTVINDINRWLLTTWSDSIDFQISRSVLGSIESEPIDVTVVLMQAYQNKSGKSGIVAYEIGNDFIKVKFKDSEPYLYNYKTPGADHVEEMKKRAIDGIGLNTYINKQVKNNYYNKVM